MLSCAARRVGLAVMGMTSNWQGMVAGMALQQTGAGMAILTLIAWAQSRLPFAHRGRGMGVWTATFFFGQFSSPLLVSVLREELGSMQAAGRKTREAISSLLRASEVEPLHIQTWIGLSMLYASVGERPRALQSLQRAADLDRAQVEEMARKNGVISGLLGELR